MFGKKNTVPDTCSSSKFLELYAFFNPFDMTGWKLEPILKRLSFEIGKTLTIRRIIHLPISKCNNETLATQFLVSAYKAAQMQGIKAATSFLYHCQTNILLGYDITQAQIIFECAEKANLDMKEFQNDLNSPRVHDLMRKDLLIAHEMSIKETPTFVFFGSDEQDEGIKVEGLQSYDIYRLILQELLHEDNLPLHTPLSIVEFIKQYHAVSEYEMMIIFDISRKELQRELKKFQLQRLIEPLQCDKSTDIIWQYNHAFLVNQS